MQGRRSVLVLTLSLFVLLSILLSFSSVGAVDQTFDLGWVNFPEPKIIVNYTEPVQILYDYGAGPTMLQLITTLGYTDIGIDFTPSKETLDENRIIFPTALELGNGDYLLTVAAVDAEAQPSPIATATFTVTGLQMRLKAPPPGVSEPSGFSPTSPYDVVIETGVYDQELNFLPSDATCKYFLGHKNPEDPDSYDPDNYPNEFDPPWGYENRASSHTATLSVPETPFAVLCRDFKNDGSVARTIVRQFTVGYDDTPPDINVTVTPESVEDPNNPFASVLVESDDKVYCEISTTKLGVPVTVPFSSFQGNDSGDYESYDTLLGHVIEFDNDLGVNRAILDLEHHEFPYTVACTNLAGRSSTATETVVVDFDTPLDIVVTSPQHNPTSMDPVIVAVTTSADAACTLGDGSAMQQDSSRDWHVQTSTAPFANYSLRVNCTGANKKNSIVINFTTDRVAPTDVLINASANVCDNNASAFLSADDNFGVRGYYWLLRNELGVEEGSGFSDNGLISVAISAPAAQQTLTWEAIAQDFAGNNATAVPVSVTVAPASSDICDTSPFIQYYDPPLGWDTYPFDLTIATKREADCRYANAAANPGLDWNAHIPFDQASQDGRHHTKLNFDLPQWSYHFLCNESDGTLHERVLSFGVDNTPPDILVAQANPNPVIDFAEKWTNITARTDDEAVCSLFDTESIMFDGEDTGVYASYTTDHTHIQHYDQIADFEEHIFDYDLICQNRAGLSDATPLPVIVDFAQDFAIEILSPKQYTNNPAVTLVVKPAVTATCEYRDTGGTFNTMTAGANGTHSASLGTLSEGAHTYLVHCTSAAGQASAAAAFTIDTAAPAFTILTNTIICQGYDATIRLNVSDNSSGFGYADLVMVLPNGTSIRLNITGTRHTFTTYQYPLGALGVSGVAYDKAGNPSPGATATTEIVDATDDRCSGTPMLNCGDGKIDFVDGEQCDGSVPAGSDCTDFDSFISGTLSCVNCLLDTSACVAPAPTCGNNLIESGEECDTTIPPGLDCTSLGYAGGNLSCSSCMLDVFECTGLPVGTCGDGSVSDGEICDGSSAATCVDLGFGSGTLTCTPGCHFNTTACNAAAICGDAFIQPGEQCDGSNFGNVLSCKDVNPLLTGSPSCDPLTCMFDLTSCGGGGCSLSCGADGTCNDNCVFAPGCSPDPDCGGGCTLNCDADDYCESACETDPNCFADPDCGEPVPACDLTCLYDDVCNEDCATTSGCSADPDCAGSGGFNMWGLILIILGLLVIGGCSYYLYYAYQQRLTQQREQAALRSRQQAAMQQPRSRISPEERARMLAALKKKREQELTHFRQHAAENREERHKAVDAFGGPEKEDGKDDTKGEQETERSGTQKTDGKFIPLQDLKKQKSDAIDKRIDELKKKTTAAQGKDAAFDKLDELIDEENE